MTSAADLFALQEIDLMLDARRAVIADIDSRVGETEELIEARESVDDAAFALERLRRRQKEAETQLQDLDAKIGPLEKRLYDGSITNPKELTDLQKELDSFKAQRGKLDDQGLELIESVEKANRALEAAKQDLADVEKAWQAEQARLGVDRQKAEAESAALEAQRATRTKGMDPSALGLYEKLRSTRQGRGVARVERGTCQGCRLTLPTHLTQRLRTGTVLIQCPSCERILVAG
ncbi:MAG TPA: C4-type zinc ribbon domain-containing protein [Dehalococcoidia bacterium]|jgi:predicted  nucleic acid-binding Zn-ribbon protein|nr:C4-type zinc ribbon domain-containing protein [Dehalococcoidia bacterium]